MFQVRFEIYRIMLHEHLRPSAHGSRRDMVVIDPPPVSRAHFNLRNFHDSSERTEHSLLKCLSTGEELLVGVEDIGQSRGKVELLVSAIRGGWNPFGRVGEVEQVGRGLRGLSRVVFWNEVPMFGEIVEVKSDLVDK